MFIIILLVLEIVVFCFAIVYKDVVSWWNDKTFLWFFIKSFYIVFLKAKEEVQNFFKATIKEYKTSEKESDGPTLMWNQMMARLECCGVNNYNDFDTSTFWQINKGSRVAPDACCILTDKIQLTPKDTQCPFNPSESNSYYMKVSRVESLSAREFSH